MTGQRLIPAGRVPVPAVTPAWASLAAATVSDALDRVGVAGQAVGLEPVGGPPRLLGRAFTVRMVPIGASEGTVGDYIDEVPRGAVVAIDNGARRDCTVWGDLLTTVAARRELAGTIIDGVCRDREGADRLAYPVYARGVFMRTGKGRVRAAEFGEVVTIGGVAVCPGDLVLGDRDGIVVVPCEVEQPVLEAALEIAEREEAIRAELHGGSRLAAARARHGYHSLQRQSHG